MAQGQKHTPGPWTVEAFNRDPRLQHSAYKPVDVKMPDGTQLRISNGIEGDANARLIAAAPDMLAALVALDASWTETFPKGPDGYIGENVHPSDDHAAIWRTIRAAIQKATGGKA